MRAAAVQVESTPDRAANLATAERLVGQAASQGATFVVLPELFQLLGSGRDLRDSAELFDGPTTAWASTLARRHGVWLVPGSFVEAHGGAGRDVLSNTTCLVAPDGSIRGRYRKIHLFDVDLADTGAHESNLYSPGSEPLVVDVEGVKVGFTICYDLRFPELYRIEALAGADVIVVPSAFTARTGRDHWEVLLRARAIENQVYVVAPDQCGTSADGTPRHGRSLVVDPWGTVLADAGDAPGLALADIELDVVRRTRAAVPSLANRRPEAYRWPDTTVRGSKP